MTRTAAPRLRRFTNTAVIRRIPAGTDPDARETVIAALKCSPVYEMDREQRERADMGTITAARNVFCEVPAVTIQKRMRFVLGNKDYVIHHARNHPADNPQFVELYLEDESP